MRRKSTGRGTRHPRGVESASTLAITSGGTICEGGIEVASATFLTWAQLGYLNSAADNLNSISGIPIGHVDTAGYKMSGGSIEWAGASQPIDTGLTNIVAVIGSQGWIDSKTSAVVINWQHNPSTAFGVGGVSIGLVASSDIVTEVIDSGGSICWLAFGT